ncbi:MAG: hypothetical protein ACUVQZ_10105 [Candidatus Caldatribacteriaceae bacterium]
MQRKKNFFWRLFTGDTRCDGVLVQGIDPMHRLEPFIFPTGTSGNLAALANQVFFQV